MLTITPTLDKDIAHALAKETRKGIANELQGDLFGIFLDLCSPPSTFKHYMVLSVRYLNGKGELVERLLGIVPEPDVHDSALEVAVDLLLSEAGLSLSNVRGQGYGLAGYSDETFTELTTSPAKVNTSAYCVHPYACQLHSILASASQDLVETCQLFQTVDVLSNLIQDSSQFREKVHTLIQERGLNPDSDLEKPGETCWGSYYEALVKLAAYFTPVCDALDLIEEHSSKTNDKYMVFKIQRGLSYDFAYGLLLLRDVLGVTNELSVALDRKDLDAENCAALLQEAKKQLLVMRDEGWASFPKKVDVLCTENYIPVPNMGEIRTPGKI
uniref:Uncharacterized protein n=1 Tax=Arundo donax TaxID=35708 RepID=A0A0A8XV00_ARUDO